jgi:hypothetical protein
MARKKQPDYGKAFKGASAALTAMKIKAGRLHGSYLGSGDRSGRSIGCGGGARPFRGLGGGSWTPVFFGSRS